MKPVKKVLIFDFDGVIADTLSIHVQIYDQLSKKFGLKLIKTPEEYADIFDTNFYYALGDLGLPKEHIDDFLASWKKLFHQEFKNIPLYHGIKNAVQVLAKDNEMCIVSANSSKLLRLFLNSRDISDFSTILGGEEGKSKVSKLRSLKEKYPNHDYYYITDTVGDIIEANEAKVKSVAVTWGFHNREKLVKENPDYAVDSVEELLSLF